ncbi:MAG: restriction endonuclease subunit S [Eggerthellaceae bacterium]|nr:restriction endonuclease subunit S [Eggerthellaceae bacterium]
MSKVNDMVKCLCPDGVEYRDLHEIAIIRAGRDYKHLGKGTIPVYGSGGVMTYVDNFTYDKPTVLLPRKGSIGNVFYVDEPFWNVDTIFYTEINESIVMPRFFYHVMLSRHIERLSTSNAARPALTKKVLDKVRVPVPPMEIQQEIVCVLDSFAELEAELEARRAQYAHYRNALIDGIASESMPLSKLAQIGTGSRDTKDAVSDGEFVFYARGVDSLRLDEYDFDETAVITAGDGAGVGRVFHFVEGKYALHQRAYRMAPDEEKLYSRFFYHVLNARFYDYIMANCVSSSVSSIRRKMLDNFPVPIPSLEEQHRIAGILDKFDALVNDISQGLPAEIEARRKQYAYYRDKLLSFKEKVA